jgi:hypothetical protein
MHSLRIPISEEEVRSLKVGDPVLLSESCSRTRCCPQVDGRDVHQQEREPAG